MNEATQTSLILLFAGRAIVTLLRAGEEAAQARVTREAHAALVTAGMGAGAASIAICDAIRASRVASW